MISIEIHPDEAATPATVNNEQTWQSTSWLNSEAIQSIGFFLVDRRHMRVQPPQTNPMTTITLLSGLSVSFFLASLCLSVTNPTDVYVALCGYMLGVCAFIAAACNCCCAEFDWQIPLEPGVPVGRARRLMIAATNPRMSNHINN